MVQRFILFVGRKKGRVMSTTNISTPKRYCACSGKWCEFANLQGFCTLTACCKRVIYDDRTTIIKRKEGE